MILVGNQTLTSYPQSLLLPDYHPSSSSCLALTPQLFSGLLGGRCGVRRRGRGERRKMIMKVTCCCHHRLLLGAFCAAMFVCEYVHVSLNSTLTMNTRFTFSPIVQTYRDGNYSISRNINKNIFP